MSELIQMLQDLQIATDMLHIYRIIQTLLTIIQKIVLKFNHKNLDNKKA